MTTRREKANSLLLEDGWMDGGSGRKARMSLSWGGKAVVVIIVSVWTWSHADILMDLQMFLAVLWCLHLP